MYFTMKKNRLIISILLICALTLGAFTACGDPKPSEPESPAVKPKFAVIKGPSGLGALQILEAGGVTEVRILYLRVLPADTEPFRASSFQRYR